MWACDMSLSRNDSRNVPRLLVVTRDSCTAYLSLPTSTPLLANLQDMAGKTLVNTAHTRSGPTALAFSRDGSYVYTGGADSLGRIWRTDQGTDQDPDAAMEAGESITCVAAGVSLRALLV